MFSLIHPSAPSSSSANADTLTKRRLDGEALPLLFLSDSPLFLHSASLLFTLPLDLLSSLALLFLTLSTGGNGNIFPFASTDPGFSSSVLTPFLRLSFFLPSNSCSLSSSFLTSFLPLPRLCFLCLPPPVSHLSPLHPLLLFFLPSY